MKKIITSVFALSLATTMTGCLDELLGEEETDTDTGTTQSNLEVVAQNIAEHSDCATTCHSGAGVAQSSGLVFTSTTADGVEAALTNFIAEDYAVHSVTAKTVPSMTGETHTGGNVWENDLTGKTAYETLVDSIAADVLDDLTTPVTSLISGSNCTTCHGDSPIGNTLSFGDTPTNASVQAGLTNPTNTLPDYIYSQAHGGSGFTSNWSQTDTDAVETLVNAL